MKIGVAVLARLASRRFPRKMLSSLGPETLVQRVVRRSFEAGLETVLAVPDDDDDTFRGSVGVEVFSARNESPLVRLGLLMRHRKWDAVVRVNGDCPDIDPADIRRVADVLRKGEADYVSFLANGRNAVIEKVGTPEGMTEAAISRAFGYATAILEHVTLPMYQPPPKFKTKWLGTDKTEPNCIDTPEDLERWKSKSLGGRLETTVQPT